MHIDNHVFDEFLSLLEPAYADSDQRFRQVRFKLVKFFSWRRCDDPYSLTDETISRLVKNICTGEKIRTDKPYSYVYGIASNVFKEYLREKRNYPEVSDDVIEVELPPLPHSHDCRKECLQALPNDKILLLERYYLIETDMEMLARSLGISIGTLRLQIHRIKKDLKACYHDCMKRKS